MTPLILRHNLTLGGSAANDDLISLMFSGNRDSIEIPATAGQEKSFAAGDSDYMVELEFLADTSDDAISMLLFEAMDTAAGTITVSGTLREGAVGPSNKSITGTAIVTSFGELGGRVNTVARGRARLPLTGRPVLAES